jgi:2-desacetyl-2-hydroxyethyl bacteriochlorophyllide A dehydrogenase
MQIVGCSRDGAFAEFMSVPERAALRIESDGTAAHALFSESIPSAYHALFEVAKLSRGQRVLVMGTGGIGLTTVYLASVCDLEVTVVGRKLWKLEKARNLGASNAFSFNDLSKNRRDFDVAIDTTGIPAVIETGIRSIRPGGQVVVVGYPMKSFEVPGRRFMWYEQSIVGSRAFSHNTVLQAHMLSKAKRLDPSKLVSHMLSLEKIDYAVSLLSKGDAARILILPSNSS